jgi:hypothetical protein
VLVTSTTFSRRFVICRDVCLKADAGVRSSQSQRFSGRPSI